MINEVEYEQVLLKIFKCNKRIELKRAFWL